MEQRFPMEQGCSAAGRWGTGGTHHGGPRPGAGPLRGYVLGEGGQMDLGTLLPEGGGRRLHRTVPVAELRKRGCWPVTGGKAVLTYAFSGGSTQSGPRGWTGLDRPETCFPADPVLAQGAREGGGPSSSGGGTGCSVWPGPGIPGGPSPWSPPSAWPRSRVWGGGGMWFTTLPQRGGPLWRERPRRVRPPACRRCRAGSTAPGRPEVPRGCPAR